MNESDRALLEDLLVIEILRMAKEMKAERNTTSDCIKESISLVRKKRPEILRILSETI